MFMNLDLHDKKKRRAGFTLVETMVAMGVFGVGMFSLYAGISLGFSIVNHTREGLRATQIMVEKMETIRLYSWEQINTSGFIPATFTEYYYPPGNGNTNGWSAGVTFTGTVALGTGPTGLSYSTNLTKVTIGLNWVTGGVSRSKQMSTYVARNGLQNYIY
jgi:prepilin-type N-terminal cleavage/methylation domain-containing protein